VGDRQERRRELELLHRPLVAVDRLETLFHYVVACVLFVIAAIVVYHTVDDLITLRHDFAVQVTTGINDVLFLVILLELLRTVVAHLETNDFQLRSFLIIGIISAVRHILAVGARLTLTEETSSTQFARSQIELGVSAAVVLALALGCLLISRAGVDVVGERTE
jgi:uncharacterized membrane protein (DUF373 family)